MLFFAFFTSPLIVGRWRTRWRGTGGEDGAHVPVVMMALGALYTHPPALPHFVATVDDDADDLFTTKNNQKNSRESFRRS